MRRNNNYIEMCLTSDKWLSEKLSKGEAFLRGCLFRGKEKVLLKHVGEEILEAPNSIQATLDKYSGFFSLIIISENSSYVFVDNARSIPMFFSIKSNKTIISDSADWIRERLDVLHMDAVSEKTFRLSENVLNNNTLFGNIKQLVAGEYLECVVSGSDSTVEKVTKYFFYNYKKNKTEKSVEEIQREALNIAFDKLIRYAAGRQIVVPLSGGYDSRLIASMLKRSGYENVFTFSYGLKGNRDSELSHVIAKKCNLKWAFVEYTASKWGKVWKSSDRKKCQFYAAQWSSLPHMQDWLAIKELKRENLLEKDCVFVPGHRGVLCGLAHIPIDLVTKEAIKQEEFVDSIWKNHLILAPYSDISTESINEIRKLIGVLSEKLFTADIFIKQFEHWQWQERQTKFLVNSVRIYEFLGFDWWLPLWDKDFVKAFLYDSIDLLSGRKTYDELVRKIYSETTGFLEDYNVGNANESFSSVVRKVAREQFSKNLFTRKIYNAGRNVRRLLRKEMLRVSIPSHMGFEGRYPDDVYSKLRRSGYTINGVHSYFFLEQLKKFLSKNS